MMTTSLYYCCALLVATAGVGILFTSQPFLATIYLLGIIIGLAAIYFCQGAALIAMLQIILHVGGVLVLLIYSLLFHPQAANTNKPSFLYLKITCLSIVILSIGMIGRKLHAVPWPWISPHGSITINSTTLSDQLVGPYGLVLEFVSILLLITLVGILHILTKDNH